MKHSGVTVSGLMIVVVVIGLGLAGLRSGTALWAGAVVTATLAILLASLLGVLNRRGAPRAFWSGFALFGWAYLVAAEGPWFRTELAPHLITSRLIDELDLALHPTPQSPASVFESWDDDSHAYVKFDIYRLWETNRLHFRRIGHSLLALLLAPLGGMLSLMTLAARTADE